MSNEVYNDTMDNEKWRLLVEARDDGSGVADLRVIEVATDTVIHQEEVGLAYGAIFGPDADDVLAWQSVAMNVVDFPEKRKPPQTVELNE